MSATHAPVYSSKILLAFVSKHKHVFVTKDQASFQYFLKVLKQFFFTLKRVRTKRLVKLLKIEQNMKQTWMLFLLVKKGLPKILKKVAERRAKIVIGMAAIVTRRGKTVIGLVVIVIEKVKTVTMTGRVKTMTNMVKRVKNVTGMVVIGIKMKKIMTDMARTKTNMARIKINMARIKTSMVKRVKTIDMARKMKGKMLSMVKEKKVTVSRVTKTRREDSLASLERSPRQRRTRILMGFQNLHHHRLKITTCLTASY